MNISTLSNIPTLAAYKRAWRVFAGYAKRIRENRFASHFEIGLHIIMRQRALWYAGISKRSQRGGLEKLSFLSLQNRENPWFYWVFRVFLCTLRDGFLAVFSQISRKFLAVFSQFPKVFEPILNWFGDYLGLFNSLRRHIEAVITRLSWKQFGSESPRGFESLCLRHKSESARFRIFYLIYQKRRCFTFIGQKMS